LFSLFTFFSYGVGGKIWRSSKWFKTAHRRCQQIEIGERIVLKVELTAFKGPKNGKFQKVCLIIYLKIPWFIIV